MELRILHLYHDLLNLYGEIGNIKVLSKHLADQGIIVSVQGGSVGDDVDFAAYDFVYIGSGTERNQFVALNDLKRHRDELKAAIDGGLVMLATGNSIELFGRYIRDTDGQTREGLGLFDYHAEWCRERISTDIIYRADFLERDLVGYVNRAGMAYGIDTHLFEVRFGVGANKDSNKEGIRYNNFYGTYVIGPILAKNPHFLEYISRSIIKSKDTEYIYKEIRNENQYRAYETALSELTNRMNSISHK
ncbi:MAG TPA: glutamine amidotransferase [Candidatus Atribacteria bacterium]|nr:glutamine amidotransferase [Candidatus Atribacteria bacterium]HPT77492.1 glutamine amidotransferase [Candidatus Atribacteria bacterium]